MAALLVEMTLKMWPNQHRFSYFTIGCKELKQR